MEILSTGEKIKRARVYKGLTLKDLCEDKISVSKMSCIENNKIKPDLWILEFVSKKLDLDLEYLKKDVDEQLEENLNRLKNQKVFSHYEEDLKIIMDYSEKYNNYERAFEAMHILFQYYFKNKNVYGLQDIQCTYYDLYEKSYTEKNQIIYYMDIALYLYSNNEIPQCMNYYDKVIEILRLKKELSIEEKSLYSEVLYSQSNCHLMLNQYAEAYKIGIKLKDLVNDIKDINLKSKVYQLLANLSIRNDINQFSNYEEKSYDSFSLESYTVAKLKMSYAETFFQVDLKDRAFLYLEEAISICPKEEKYNFVSLHLDAVKILLDNNFLEKAEPICDIALNDAISLDDIRFIERAYYYKSLICMSTSKEYFAEMYMNLSLDSIVKFGNKEDIYNRYLELGKMYNKINNVREALKYFGLAISIESKL